MKFRRWKIVGIRQNFLVGVRAVTTVSYTL